jgi:hypothetical protein
MSSKYLENIAENFKEMRERRGEMLPKPKKSKFGSLLGVMMQHVPLEYVAVLQKQQAKACWKCCKNTNKSYRNFCVYTENFQQSIMI